ncbi:hypothetical protein MPSEU_000714500 [Mayamaea pseudoterrestris]|nr:hypothetical protein MPSEU_000714500 [Mayamaea pseudoterrestris]
MQRVSVSQLLWIGATGSLASLANGFSIGSRPSTNFLPKDGSRRLKTPTTLKLASAPTISSNEDLLPGIAAIDASNGALYLQLEDMRTKPYFRLYSVDILASCEYLPQELFECYSETCEIYPVDEDEVPDEIRKVDADEHVFELDGWSRWDMPSEDYYDLEIFPEAYTGYDGSDIWSFIHNRICFDGYEYDDDHWKADFNKAVSGLHSMISAQVVRGIQERVLSGEGFSKDEQWTEPAKEFDRRLSLSGETPLAIENLYFTYMLLLTAVSNARSRLLRDAESGTLSPEEARDLKAILASPLLDNPSVGVASRKLHDHAVKDSDALGNLWEARMRSRELMRIMNCVQCNKCRLHGKVAVMGLSTALQILVGRTGEGGDMARIHRVELAALITTLHKFSRAVDFVQQMQKQ